MRTPEVPTARKNVLLASASILAMAVACSDVSAADLPVLPAKAPAAIDRRMELVGRRWIHGPPAGDPSIGFLVPAIATFSPGPGWEAAIGFDYRRGEWSPYHISMQFRYGENDRGSRSFSGGPFPITLATPFFFSPTPANVNASGSDSYREDHWLVDFAVGRTSPSAPELCKANSEFESPKSHPLQPATEIFWDVWRRPRLPPIHFVPRLAVTLPSSPEAASWV